MPFSDTAKRKQKMRASLLQNVILVGLCLMLAGLLLVWGSLSKLVLKAGEPEPERVLGLQEGRDGSGILPCPSHLQLNASSTRLHVYKQFRQSSPLDDLPARRDYSERILILTPISNSGNYLQHYFKMLCSLSYPHGLISVALGEDSSQDKTYPLAVRFANQLSKVHFQEVKVFHLSDELKGTSAGSRHDPGWQLTRRTHLAKSRNQLLMYAIGDQDWVLWIDSDVQYVPPDLIQHLLSAEGDIVVPSCLYKAPDGSFPIYDRNTWQETNSSLAYLANKKPDYLMLEGYDRTRRAYLPHLMDKGKKVPIDGVGGCTLLVRSECHRNGLVFPPFVFDHHIETEGLGRVAKQMNYSMWGLPSVSVFHS